MVNGKHLVATSQVENIFSISVLLRENIVQVL